MNHIIGDITTLEYGVLIHQVNCQGAMNSGVAGAIRAKWPIVYEQYRALWEERTPADLLGLFQPVQVADNLVVVNLFGQLYYGRDHFRYTSYDAIDEALSGLASWMLATRVDPEDVHHPLLGCGLGGGKWSVVSSIILENLGPQTNLWTLKERS